jgi:formylglycine-generating enzyme required for sulfatase activity
MTGSMDILPAPFDWITIQQKEYRIAKYPVTNAQFAQFVEAGGYQNRAWWTETGWAIREGGWHRDGEWNPSGNPWIEPRFWNDSQWNGAGHPVVGVSWYEAEAFCLWLSDITGEKILLPTEDQWQYAAQGEDNRVYPWGDDWDASRCNNSVEPAVSRGTTPVTQYEGRGASPFGVVDMAGNVWEWCLTAYGRDGNSRVLRGASWNSNFPGSFRCTDRFWSPAYTWFNFFGFRLACAG